MQIGTYALGQVIALVGLILVAVLILLVLAHVLPEVAAVLVLALVGAAFLARLT